MYKPLTYEREGNRYWRCEWCGAEREVRSFHGTHLIMGHTTIGIVCAPGNTDHLTGVVLEVACEAEATEGIVSGLERRLVSIWSLSMGTSAEAEPAPEAAAEPVAEQLAPEVAPVAEELAPEADGGS